MSDDSGGLPLELKALFRKERLGKLRGAAALDNFELELFAWYLRESDALIARMETEEVAYVKQQSEAGDPEPNDSGIIATTYYARRVNYSHVIYLASLFESVMKRECRRLIDALGEQNVPFLPADLKGDPWTAKRRVLEKYGHFEIPSDLWKPLQQLLDIRNVLAHENGAIDSLHADQRRALAKAKGVHIVFDELEVTAEYVQETFAAVKQIANFLDGRVSSVIDKAIRPRAVK